MKLEKVLIHLNKNCDDELVKAELVCIPRLAANIDLECNVRHIFGSSLDRSTILISGSNYSLLLLCYCANT